ncbi:hypothetical protein APHAL10511_000310 [Amanita phalloides]|nr:hypothetical protein APHAL10511_000310 [Amanita phalloides]
MRPLRLGQLKLWRTTQAIQAILQRQDPEPKIVSCVQRHLDRYLVSRHASHRIFPPTISILIYHRRFQAASIVYDRMIDAGFVPPLALDANMLAATLVLSPHDPTLTATFDGILSNPHFTERLLNRTLRLMLHLGADHRSLIDLIEKFIQAKSEDYTPGKILVSRLVDALVRAGRLEEALETLARYEDALASLPTHDDPTAAAADTPSSSPPTRTSPFTPPAQMPYVSILAAIRDTRPNDPATLNRVLTIMRAARIDPNMPLFNVLVSYQVRHSRLHQAFAIYALLNKHAQTAREDEKSGLKGLAPDVSTYASLWTGLYRLYDPATARKRARELASASSASSASPSASDTASDTQPEPIRILSPRRLFFAMMHSHLFHVPRVVELTPSLLTLSIRALLRSRDYAGAYVALSSFWRMHQSLSPRAYLVVLAHLLGRVRWDLKRWRFEGEVRWGDTFLGTSVRGGFARGREGGVDREVWAMDVGDGLARRLVLYAGGGVFDVGRGLMEEGAGAGAGGNGAGAGAGTVDGERMFVTPRMEVIKGEEKAEEGVRFSRVPLKRLLHRALWAEMKMRARQSRKDRDRGGRFWGEDGDWLVIDGTESERVVERKLLRAIHIAKDEMVPRQEK